MLPRLHQADYGSPPQGGLLRESDRGACATGQAERIEAGASDENHESRRARTSPPEVSIAHRRSLQDRGDT